MAKKILIFGLIFGLTLVLFLPVFRVYFTGDDFFHFKIAHNLFGFHPVSLGGYAFYRPIFREVLYSTFYWVWGLNALPLRILSFGLHFANVILVFVLINKVLKSEKVAYLTSFLFSVAAANAGAIYYLAGGLQAQGATLFVLSTLILFPKHKVLAFMSFVLSLMSHELALATPVLIGGLMFVNKNFKLKYLWPYLLTVAVYLYIDLKVIGFSSSEIQYKPTLNPKTILNSLFWYSLWSFGLPETLIDLVNPGFKLNPNLMKNWGELYKFIFPAFFVSVGAFLATVSTKLGKLKENPKLLFLALWFVAGIGMVLLLPLHKSTYYLTLSLPAFFGIVSFFLFEKSFVNRIFSTIFIIAWGVLNVYTIRVMDITYWAAERGRASARLINDIKEQYPTLPKGAVLYVKNDPSYPFVTTEWGGTSKQASLILSGSDALRLLYNDPDLKVYYQDLNKEELPEANIFEFTAKIN